MPVLHPADLLDRFDALPGAARLLAALGPHEAYAVGGSIRDLLCGRLPRDVDVALSGGDVAAVARALGARPRTHDRFGTATVHPDGQSRIRYDLALARRETYLHPGALPQVTPASIDEDLGRRDFTVNALALGIAGPRRGHLLTVPDAVEDLAAGRLRVLHDHSFLDDPTRLLRLVRYGARFGWPVETHTAALARAAVAGGALDTVSPPRVGAELTLLLGEDDPVAAVTALGPLGLDAAIAAGFGLPDADLARRAVALLAAGGPAGEGPAVVVLAAALLGVTATDRRGLLDRLAIDHFTRDRALAAAADGPPLAVEIPVDGPPSRLLATLPVDAPATVALAGALGSAAVQATVRRWLAELAPTRLDIDGHDLLRAGVARGPSLGVGLRAALGAKLDGRAPTAQTQLEVALAAARGFAS